MFIDVGDAKLYATSFGPRSAPAIVAIGGWIGSWELWAEPFAILSERWRTIAYDHRGTGATVAPVESITLANLVADLFAVLDAYGIEQCTLAAESAGALTALGAALRDPKRISRLVIVDGMYHRDVPPDTDPFLAGLRKAYPATLDRFVQLCIPEPDCDHLKRWGRQIIDRASQDAAIALRVVSTDTDVRSELPNISQPTLVIHGDADVIVPVARGGELAAALPNARLVVLPGAGHVPTLTRPAEVAREIEDFLLNRR
jgi:pimeloyl-ACP methyl ester carboxylesterase